MKPYLRILLAAATLAVSAAEAGQIVSNLTETYDFSAGLSGAFVRASSFTTGAQAYQLDNVTLDLQVNSPGTVALSLFTDNGGVPGAAIENLGTQFINAYGGDYDTVYTASGTTLLQPNTRYWLVVEQTGGDPSNNNHMSIQWVSTTSTAESSPAGVTIGNDMYYRPVGQMTWTPTQIGPSFPTDTGQFAIDATLVGAGHIVSNLLTEPFDFRASLSGVYIVASSFRMAAQSRTLGGVTVALLGQPGTTSRQQFSAMPADFPAACWKLSALNPSASANQRTKIRDFRLTAPPSSSPTQRIGWSWNKPGGRIRRGAAHGPPRKLPPAAKRLAMTCIPALSARRPGLRLKLALSHLTDTGRFTVHATDSDADLDGILDIVDNCPAVANADQADDDGDFAGNDCDNCLAVANVGQCDSDADGYGNRCDGDLNNRLASRIPRTSCCFACRLACQASARSSTRPTSRCMFPAR